MKGFLLSLRSEFYKSRKTLGFWSAILLPLILITLISLGFYTHSSKLAHLPGLMLWMQFAGAVLNIMGALLLPMFVIFIGYSVNAIEHKADTWKTLFSLPIAKWSVYSAKFAYALLLVFISLLLFALFTIGFGNLLGLLKPELKFAGTHMELTLFQIYFKLFLSALGILSIQFLLSLLWSDFLKPMGIGFVCFIIGVISVGVNWEYAYLIPYAHPMLALKSMIPHTKGFDPNKMAIDIFTQDVFVSLAVFAVVFVAGFFIVQRKSVK
ncbi:ABC transporter permease [Mucilaginibacter sp. UR6-11]|uniref:ABC transporter permease n=1 Tax=Mucilaginibacter sp. UR6-11 TaxID=1435644 RepID=UPI001E30D7E0|nr:ABC transporter permease [Mucilaginibacter sp. UR6-11]MCC8425321.1 ABC transporter permease [Mucilaginibacter sp. UR6-11]